MTLRPRSAALALSGAAVVTLLTASACSSDGDGGGTTEGTGTATAAGTSGPPVVDAPPATPLQQVVLQPGEAPGNGLVEVRDPATLGQAVDKLVADQGRQIMVDPACDRVSRLETVMNHATTDAVIAAVRYRQAENNETEHQFAIGMVASPLADFLDRGVYQACTRSESAGQPPVTLTMTVSDAPAVAGTRGFRVTSDFAGTDPATGRPTTSRVISLHGYAHGTTVSVDYAARGSEAGGDPVLPEANAAFEAIYTAQMTKLAGAQ